MTFREVVLRAKQFVTFSVSVKHKKDKFTSAYIYTLLILLPRQERKCVFIHCLLFVVFLLFFCFNRKRLEQIL